MTQKILYLRNHDSEWAFEDRRLEGNSEFEDGAELILAPGRTSIADVPASIASLYAVTYAPYIGDILFYAPDEFVPVDELEGVASASAPGGYLRIGHAGEFSVFLGRQFENILVFDPIYFNHGAESGIAMACESLYEFVNDVALGPRYRELFGPVDLQGDRWWSTSSWYSYLEELGWT
ncbi:hypothetical protein [Nocardia salmonicida]|uniref:hypothetical protein n=1 Tax=Nocardia salmonicida TaxID=53431 RepID=UPI00379CB998